MAALHTAAAILAATTFGLAPEVLAAPVACSVSTEDDVVPSADAAAADLSRIVWRDSETSNSALFQLQTSAVHALREAPEASPLAADGGSRHVSPSAAVAAGIMQLHQLMARNQSLPLNGAVGERSANQIWIDRAMLLFCLLLPCAIFLVCRILEMRALAKRPDTGDVAARNMSEYRLEEPIDSKPISITSLIEPNDGDEPEGTCIRNVLSGVVIALGCLPEAISFSFITGVSPLNGIWAGIFMGLCSSLVGGRPGLISCASAATAVVLVDVTQDPELGIGPLALCVLICGMTQLLVGVTRLSRLISLVPHPVMLGFVNGLAIVIARAQISQFREAGANTPFVDKRTLTGMVLTTLVSMSVAMIAPRVPHVGRLLPAPLVAILCAIGFSAATSSWYPTRTLVDVAGAATFQGGLNSLPAFDFPPQGLNSGSQLMWHKVFFTGVKMAVVGLVESLLTLKLVDQMTETRGSTTRECYGQGLGNIISGLFGVQGGCALIGQTLINVGSGGKGRVSGFTMAVGLLASVVVFAPVVGHIPIAALVGIMFLVSLNTFAWSSLRLFHEMAIKWTDGAVIILVTVVTVFRDLATAVISGLVFSALVFAWDAAADVHLEERDEVHNGGPQIRTFSLRGPLFFGSSMSFQQRIDVSKIREQEVVLDFSQSKVLDHSGLDAIVKTLGRLRSAGKRVRWEGLTQDAEFYISRHDA